MIYTKYWYEYCYKTENSTDADGIGILYVGKNPYFLYYKDGTVLYEFIQYSPKIAIYL